MAVALSVFETDVLYRVQEQSLFLHTPLFFRQCMVSSGGLLSWLGCWLTQFFYYPLWGILILSLCWAALMVLLLRTFRISARWAVVALVPVVLLLIADVDLGYWIFYLKLRGHFYVATLGTIAAVAMTWGFRWLAVRAGRTVVVGHIILSVAIGYILFGFYGLLAGLLMAVISWRIGQGRRMAVMVTLAAVLTIVAVPLICYQALYHETNIVNVWWTALPVFSIFQKSYPVYMIPYVLLVASLLLMSAFYRPTRDPDSQGDGSFDTSQISQKNRPPDTRYHLHLTVLLLVGLVAATVVFWFKDTNYHRELRMSRAIGNQEWERVVAISADVADPTRDICMMRNLALFRLGRQGSEMYHYPDGDCMPDNPFPIRIVQTDGKMLYLNYGLLNFCYRWCIEDGVEYGWNVAGLKNLVKCALLNNEKESAYKFISILRKTTFHRAWCGKYENYLRNPHLMLDDPELRPILDMMKSDDDYLSSDNADIEQFLLNHFASAESHQPAYQEQTLLAALQLRSMTIFWRRFYQYTELHPGEQVPLHYQEAACLFGRLSDRVDTSHMPFDKEVVQRCDEFMAAMEQHRGQDNNMVAAALYDRFHDSYFYHYFFSESEQ